MREELFDMKVKHHLYLNQHSEDDSDILFSLCMAIKSLFEIHDKFNDFMLKGEPVDIDSPKTDFFVLMKRAEQFNVFCWLSRKVQQMEEYRGDLK